MNESRNTTVNTILETCSFILCRLIYTASIIKAFVVALDALKTVKYGRLNRLRLLM